MLKTEALELLGGTVAAAAEAIGVTYTAVNKWPPKLSKKLTDRVQAALWRKAQESKPAKARRSIKAEA